MAAERDRAFGIYGAGGAFALLLGGVLTEYLHWRRCPYVNLAFAGTAALLPRTPVEERPHLNLPSAVTASADLLALV